MNALPLLALWTPGPMELAVIAVVAVLIFGRRLPQVMRGLGGSVREFRRGLDHGSHEEDPRRRPGHDPGRREGEVGSADAPPLVTDQARPL